ncbi:MAG: TRAP transporter large permease subunit, partial [Paracoccus sp.]|nr:TRAP transporter large permease subunit [Paracoccus sp. (in: a-proteobacteria)]
VALVATVGLSYLAFLWLYPTQGKDADVLAPAIGVIAIYLAAVLDKNLKLNLMSRLAQQVVIVLIPPLALIFLVLGTIFLGIATPTEGGAMGAVGALLLALIKGRLNYDVIRQALLATTRLSAFVMFILVGARVFSLTFYGVNGHIWVEHLLTSLPGGEYGFLIAVSVLVFLLAFFLDFFELAFIIVPLLAPAAEAMGIDLIWFGVLLGVNMQTSFMHPPFGFSLFYLRSVAPKVPYQDKVTGKMMDPVTTGQIYWGAVPFVCIQLVMIAIVMLFPGMVMHYKGPPIDTSNVKIEIPSGNGLGGLGGLGGGLGGLGGNPFAAPGAPAGTAGDAAPGGIPAPGGLGGAPNFGAPAAPAAPAADAPAPGAAAPAAGGLDPLAGPPPGLNAPAPQPSN